MPLGPEYLREVALGQVDQHRDVVLVKCEVTTLGNDSFAAGNSCLFEALLVVLRLLDPVVVSRSIYLCSACCLAYNTTDFIGPQEIPLVLCECRVFAWLVVGIAHCQTTRKMYKVTVASPPLPIASPTMVSLPWHAAPLCRSSCSSD